MRSAQKAEWAGASRLWHTGCKGIAGCRAEATDWDRSRGCAVEVCGSESVSAKIRTSCSCPQLTCASSPIVIRVFCSISAGEGVRLAGVSPLHRASMPGSAPRDLPAATPPSEQTRHLSGLRARHDGRGPADIISGRGASAGGALADERTPRGAAVRAASHSRHRCRESRLQR